ncbi:hypothetical protein QBC38DRAFT_547169 [Podospora fimiseda]|uniref:Oxidoreductase FAD/NAD(P)-binding domain-containing protein n=1 Tax=Podospora fimiseda TaxID=252190 RepID=A0AAN7BKF9_9PEZI|nr:hypothetical protein QBC38DRAFT_547169 [Podospora fimiseda]
MTTKESHIDRTSHEPRDSFLPGQWLDLYYPPFPPNQKPGGFTITSSPYPPSPTLELAIQSPPSNTPISPPTQYLWTSPSSSLLNTKVKIRIGGSFTFPPSSIPLSNLKKVLFIAGGMGINPLMSMLGYLSNEKNQDYKTKIEVDVFYSVKEPERGLIPETTREILFLERISGLFAPYPDENGGLRGSVRLFATGSNQDQGNGEVNVSGVNIPVVRRRIRFSDIKEALGGDRENTAVYICGPPQMTDEFVEGLTSSGGLGIHVDRVLYEKWW